jgi:hypothetical protein
LAFDNQYLGAVSGETELESPGYSDATELYEITRWNNDAAIQTR